MRALRWPFLVVFTLWFYVASFLLMAVAVVGNLVLGVLRVPYRKHHNYVAGPIFGACVRLAGSRLTITYDPGFDRQTPSVYCQNHVNLIDAHVACASIPHAFCGLMNHWQRHIPIYGWMMTLSKGIYVKRGDAEGTIAQITRQAIERRAAGMSILVFPEAHRTRDGKLREFRTGVLAMARNAEMPLVPLAVRGNYAVNRKGSYLFVPGQPIDVYVGAQIETSGLSDSQLRALAVALRACMVSWVDTGVWPADASDAIAAAVAEAGAPASLASQ